MTQENIEYACPSAQPSAEDAKIFGVVLGDTNEPRVAYLEKGVSVSKEMLTVAAGISPTRIFRFSAKCMSEQCIQFKGGRCRLGKDISEQVAAVTQRIPACTIRNTCRWFAENGPEVCLRCARVVTTLAGEDLALSPVAIART